MATEQNLDVVISALADPTRRKIVELVGLRAYRAGELADHLGVSAPVASRHLRILLQAGIVADERSADDARVRLFRLRPQAITILRGWLDRIQADWDNQLAGFKSYAEVRAPSRAATAARTKEASNR